MQKGKGKGPAFGTCWTCGGSHFARSTAHSRTDTFRSSCPLCQRLSRSWSRLWITCSMGVISQRSTPLGHGSGIVVHICITGSLFLVLHHSAFLASTRFQFQKGRGRCFFVYLFSWGPRHGAVSQEFCRFLFLSPSPSVPATQSAIFRYWIQVPPSRLVSKVVRNSRRLVPYLLTSWVQSFMEMEQSFHFWSNPSSRRPFRLARLARCSRSAAVFESLSSPARRYTARRSKVSAPSSVKEGLGQVGASQVHATRFHSSRNGGQASCSYAQSRLHHSPSRFSSFV